MSSPPSCLLDLRAATIGYLLHDVLFVVSFVVLGFGCLVHSGPAVVTPKLLQSNLPSPYYYFGFWLEEEAKKNIYVVSTKYFHGFCARSLHYNNICSKHTLFSNRWRLITLSAKSSGPAAKLSLGFLGSLRKEKLGEKEKHGVWIVGKVY
ncbi:hypothetical protein ACFE04_011389 [Oxalis oulophora]